MPGGREHPPPPRPRLVCVCVCGAVCAVEKNPRALYMLSEHSTIELILSPFTFVHDVFITTIESNYDMVIAELVEIKLYWNRMDPSSASLPDP